MWLSTFLQANIPDEQLGNQTAGCSAMALVVDLKKGETFMIGDTIIVNDTHNRKFTNGGARLYISGDAPMLRQKDIMREEEATSPAKKLYFVMQTMYLSRDPKAHAEAYVGLVRQIQEAGPDTAPYFAKINELLQNRSYYKALKEAKNLINFEQGIDNSCSDTAKAD
jgi:flagellar protein FlbT